MGILLAKLWNLFGNEEHKICLVGLDNAGKTTILYQFLMNEVVHTSPTIGSNVEEVVWNNIHFIMWDLGGQESLRTPGTRTTPTRSSSSWWWTARTGRDSQSQRRNYIKCCNQMNYAKPQF